MRLPARQGARVRLNREPRFQRKSRENCRGGNHVRSLARARVTGVRANRGEVKGDERVAAGCALMTLTINSHTEDRLRR